MPSLVFDGITSYTEYPVQKSITDVLGAYQRIIIDNGAISLDHAEDTVEKSHIHLQADLQETHAFIKIDNAAGTTLFRIGHNGKVHALSGIEAPEITSLQALRASDSEELAELVIEYIGTKGQVTALEAANVSTQNVLNNSTQAVATNVVGSLVQRGLITEFQTLQADILNIDNSIAMYGDSNLTWVPQETVNGVLQNVPGASTRLGRNPDPAQTSGDGIEIVGRTLGTAEQNRVLLTASQTEPNVELTANKSNDAPYLRCIGGIDDDSVVELSNHGVSLKLHTPFGYHITPGQTHSLPQLHTGVTRLELFLNSDWSNESTEIDIILVGDNETEDMRFFTAEIMLDQSQVQGSSIESHVYIARIAKNVRSTTNTVSITLKIKLIAGETFIPHNTMLNLTTINHILL